MRHPTPATIILPLTGMLLTTMGGCASPSHPVEALMLVGGEYHDYEQLPVELADRLEARGDVHVTITDDFDVLDHRQLRNVDVLLFDTCHQVEITPPQREAVAHHVKSGGGLIALHCALWSYDDWPEWVEMIGGYVPGHDSFGRYHVTVLDPRHPVTLGLGRGFEITDEPYIVDRRAPDADVLIRSSGMFKDHDGQTRNGPEPQVWTRNEGKGRVLAITFGHDAQSLLSEEFITLLHNGIRWTARHMPDTPHNMLTKSERKVGFRRLFDGRSLKGWVGKPGIWSVEDGCIVGRAQNLNHHQYLIYDREQFEDFELKLGVRLPDTDGANSGIQFRSTAHDDYLVTGYQADIATGVYGSLYEVGTGRGKLADGWAGAGENAVILGGWNDLVIRALGPHITVTLNGVTTVEYDEPEPDVPDRGVIALQVHKGPPMSVRFRDIRIREIR